MGGLDPSIPESEIKDYFEQTFGKVRIILSVGWVFFCLKRLKYSSIISNSNEKQLCGVKRGKKWVSRNLYMFV